MADRYYLSERDVSVLKDIIGEYLRRKPQQRRPRQEVSLPPSPETYVAYIGPDGIPALSRGAQTGTGTGSHLGDDVPGSAECDIYRIYDAGGTPRLAPVESSRLVYNLSTSPVDGHGWRPVTRDAFGSWLVMAEQSAVAGAGFSLDLTDPYVPRSVDGGTGLEDSRIKDDVADDFVDVEAEVRLRHTLTFRSTETPSTDFDAVTQFVTNVTANVLWALTINDLTEVPTYRMTFSGNTTSFTLDIRDLVSTRRPRIALNGANASDWSVDGWDVRSGLIYTIPDIVYTADAGTMAYQDSDAVAITGGTIDGTPIGATTASTGHFTSVTIDSGTLYLYENDNTHKVSWKVANTLSADRVATWSLPDSDFTVTIGGSTSISGTNTGDQTDISGNAATVTVTVADAGGDTSTFVLLATDATGSLSPRTDAGLSYNATTNVLTASGGFVGALTGNVTGDVSGNAGTATLASTVSVDDTTDSTCWVALFESQTGNQAVKTDGGLTYNASTGVLTATGFSGPLNGTVGATAPSSGVFTSLQATGNLVVDGDLTVSGTAFTADVASYEVEDPLIKIGKGNAGDAVDLGFYGLYVSSGSKYAGLFRDATDGKWRLFHGTGTEPTTTVNTGAAGYTSSTLVAALEGNASTATALQTARNINGVAFDGTANITVTAAAGTLTGTTLNATVVTTSITSTGTLTGGATGAGFTVALSTSTITGTLPVANLTSLTGLTGAEPSITPGLCDEGAGYDVSAAANRKFQIDRLLALNRLVSSGFRLTLTAATPVTTTDVTGATTVYMSPCVSDMLILWDGTRWVVVQLPEFGIALGTLTSGKPYDVFAFTNSDTPSSTNTTTDIVTFGSATGWQTGAVVYPQTTGGGLTAGTAYYWNAASSTTGSFHTTLANALAGTSKVDLNASITSLITGYSLELLVWTNDTTRATSVTVQDGRYCKNGNKKRLYVGTFYTTATTTTEDSLTKRLLWNMYNRRLRPMLVQEATNSWTYTSAAWRSANNSTANRLQFMSGLPEDVVTAKVNVMGYAPTGVAQSASIGLDKTNGTDAQTIGYLSTCDNACALAEYAGFLTGFHYLQWVEYTSAGTATWLGDGGVAYVQSAITGEIWA